MLGKAKNVKIESFNYIENYREWQTEHPEFLIIDMKFQASYEGSILLVIYKEDDQNDMKCLKCGDPFCVGHCEGETLQCS